MALLWGANPFVTFIFKSGGCEWLILNLKINVLHNIEIN